MRPTDGRGRFSVARLDADRRALLGALADLLRRPGPPLALGIAVGLRVLIGAFDRVDRRAVLPSVPSLAWVTFTAAPNRSLRAPN